MTQVQKFTPAALSLSVLTAVLAEGIPQGVPVRRALAEGLLSAGMLCILSALATAAGQGKTLSTAAKTVFTLWFDWELLQSALQAQRVCAEEFSSMALLGFLPLLLWAGWRIRPGGWNAPARVLWWFAAVGGVVCLLGLGGQMHWYRLLEEVPAQTAAGSWQVPIYAEYFALPFLCAPSAQRRMLCLPLWSFAVQAAVLLGWVLVFGARDYPQRELLRAWSTGSFSRMDAFLLLLWLLCAVYRMAVLCASIRLLWQPESGVQTA